jgi:hypothetical protein
VRFKCEPCRGLGWFPAKRKCDFPDTCPSCNGQGEYELAQLARLLDEDPRVLENLVTMRKGARFEPARRIFAKLVARWPQERWTF